jgi:hypothetical protein
VPLIVRRQARKATPTNRRNLIERLESDDFGSRGDLRSRRPNVHLNDDDAPTALSVHPTTGLNFESSGATVIRGSARGLDKTVWRLRNLESAFVRALSH